MNSKVDFRIRVSLLFQKPDTKSLVTKNSYRELKEEDIKKASATIPPEFQAQVQDETIAEPGTKAGGGIEAILLTLMLGAYAVQPITNFIVKLYHEKKRKLKITQRWQNTEGVIQENAIEYEGNASQKDLRLLVENALKRARHSTHENRPSSKELPPSDKELPAPDIDIKILPQSDEERKQ